MKKEYWLYIILSINIFKIYCNINNFTKFVIVVASYNNSQFYKKNLDSIVNQKTKSNNLKYPNYKIIYINDCSNDNTGELANRYILNNNLNNFTKIIHNKKRMGHLYNQYNAIHSCKDSEVIVIVDGDDFLINDYVLDYLNKIYQNKNIWLTYGQFIWWPLGQIGICKEIPKYHFDNKMIRKNWYSSHLRTFYAGLFKQIKKADLYHQDKFFISAADLATMYPMLEMAGYNRVKFINIPLYLYNMKNPISFRARDRSQQIELAKIICNMIPYKLATTIHTETELEIT